MDNDSFEEFLAAAAAAFSIRYSYHQTHDHLSAQLVFGRDMFMPVDTKIGWKKIQQIKQLKIQQNNICENSKQLHKYSKRDMITLRKPGAIFCTLAFPRQGPYKIIKYHENGSRKLELESHIVDRINIYRFYPYYSLQEDENHPNLNTQQTVNIQSTFV